MSLWDNPAVVGVLGVVFGATTAYVQSALAARAKTGEELRDSREQTYPELWRTTAMLSEFPKAEPTWEDLKGLHLACRQWYYTRGGMFLSECSRARYGDFQDLLSRYLNAQGGEETVAREVYDNLARVCSALRTALAEDLETRRQRSVVWSVKRRLWHGARRKEARRLIDGAGEERLRLPLSELQLPAGPPLERGDPA